MSYTVEIKQGAQKDLLGLPDNIYDRCMVILENLKENPRPIGCLKLKGTSDKYRIRVGDFRIIYTIQDKILFVNVIGFPNRKDAY